MRSRLLSTGTRFVALIALVSLAGCTTLTSPYSSGNLTSAATSTNWQFQTGTAIGQPTGTGINLLMSGAMQIQGTEVTGTFNTTGICFYQPTEIFTYTGTYDANTGALTLAGAPAKYVSAQFTLPSDPTKVATGTMGGAGQVCAIATGAIPAVGVEIPTLTGTYTGTIADTEPTPAPGVKPGTATLTLTQSTTPNASAQFPLTGTFQFASSACSVSIPVAGTISGVGFTLASTSSTAVTITGADASGGDTLTAVTALFPGSLCNAFSATYTGTLTLQ